MLVLPLRNPVVPAKVAASIDQISDGRLVLGEAAGWAERAGDVGHEEVGPCGLCTERLLQAEEPGLSVDLDTGLARVMVTLQKPRGKPMSWAFPYKGFPLVSASATGSGGRTDIRP